MNKRRRYKAKARRAYAKSWESVRKPFRQAAMRKAAAERMALTWAAVSVRADGSIRLNVPYFVQFTPTRYYTATIR